MIHFKKPTNILDVWYYRPMLAYQRYIGIIYCFSSLMSFKTVKFIAKLLNILCSADISVLEFYSLRLVSASAPRNAYWSGSIYFRSISILTDNNNNNWVIPWRCETDIFCDGYRAIVTTLKPTHKNSVAVWESSGNTVRVDYSLPHHHIHGYSLESCLLICWLYLSPNLLTWDPPLPLLPGAVYPHYPCHTCAPLCL